MVKIANTKIFDSSFGRSYSSYEDLSQKIAYYLGMELGKVFNVKFSN